MLRFVLLMVVLGLVAWLIGFLPLPAPFPQLIWVALILCLIWELLALLGYTRSILPPGPPAPPP